MGGALALDETAGQAIECEKSGGTLVLPPR